MKNIMWNFSQFGSSTALIDDAGNRLTYEELQTENDRLAKEVGKRCLVFSMCSNTIGSVMGYTCFLKNNIVPVLLNAHMDMEFLQRLMESYLPAYIWMPGELAVNHANFEKVYESHNYVLLKTLYKKEYPLYGELAALLTTSGSTGSPKFVRQTYKNIMTNAEQIAEYLKLDETEKAVTTLPMNYTYGCSIINSHLLVGASLLLTEKSLMTKDFWSFMKEQGATSFGGVPYTYEMLEKLRFFRMDLPQLHTMTQSGGKLSVELHRKFAEYAKEKGKKFVVMYGACEATSRMAYLPHEKSLEKCGSIGIAIPGGSFKLIDENNRIIDRPDTAGELVYEGLNVTMGYAECGDDLIKGDERKGVLNTGDMAKTDKDGYYYIVGRKKRFLKIYGNRVNLDEVENLIKERFNFIDCACAGIDDYMYIFVTDASVMNEVRTFLHEKTKLNLSAFNVIRLTEIPRNDSGKILYRELTKYYKQI